MAPYNSVTPPLLKLPVASRTCTPLSASPVFWLTTVPSIVAGCAPSNPAAATIKIASFIDRNIAHPAVDRHRSLTVAARGAILELSDSCRRLSICPFAAGAPGPFAGRSFRRAAARDRCSRRARQPSAHHSLPHHGRCRAARLDRGSRPGGGHLSHRKPPRRALSGAGHPPPRQ